MKFNFFNRVPSDRLYLPSHSSSHACIYEVIKDYKDGEFLIDLTDPDVIISVINYIGEDPYFLMKFPSLSIALKGAFFSLIV
jgi:hypothetical protein